MSPPTIFHYLAPVIALTTILIGVGAMKYPEPMAKKFGIAANGLALPYVVSTGVRDIFIGLAILIVFFRQDWFSLGAIIFCIGIVAISDFIVVKKHGDKRALWTHLIGSITVIVFGSWLMAG